MTDLTGPAEVLNEIAILTEAADTLKHYVGGNSDARLREMIKRRVDRAWLEAQRDAR